MTLTLEPGEHIYRLDGRVIPSVTKILRPLSDFSHIDPDVLEAKRALGQAVHLATELDDANDLVEESVHDSVRPYLEAWRLFKRETFAVVLQSERLVFHPLHDYAGTLDRVLAISGVSYLTDIKATSEINAAVGPQTAGYLTALGDTTVLRRAVVQLKPDGTYRFKKLEDPMDSAVFLSCLSIHRWKEKHQ